MANSNLVQEDRAFDLVKYILIAAIGSVMFLLPYARLYFYDQMLDFLGITPIQLGTVLVFYGTTSTIGTFFSGIPADKYSAKWLMVISLMATGLGGAFMLTQPGYYGFLGIYILWGLSITLTYNAAFFKAIRYAGNPKQQGKLFGSANGLGFMGGGLLSMVGAGIFASFSEAGTHNGFVSVITFFTIIHFVLALCVILFWKKDKPLADEEKWQLKDALVAIKHPVTWYIGFTIYFVYAMRRCLDITTPYMGQVLGIDENATVFLGTLRELAFPLIGGLLAGYFIDKSEHKIRICQISIALSGLAFVGMYFVPTQGAMWHTVFYVALGVALVLQSGAYLTAYSLLDVAGVAKKITGCVIGVSVSIYYLPDITINYLTNYMLETYGYEYGSQYVFLIAAGHAVVAVILYSFFNRYIKRTQAEIAARAAV